MKYSLISKFQGAYIGCFLDKTLSDNKQILDIYLTSNLIIQDLIRDLDDDLAIWNKYFSKTQNFTISDIVISLLPWILLRHDNWYQLQDLISQVTNSKNIHNEEQELIEAWIYEAILCLREKLDLKNPVKQIVNNKKIYYDGNFEQLQLIEIALLEGQSSKQLLEKLLIKNSDYSRIELLFSLYLFWSIPEDFSLIVKRGISLAKKFRNVVHLIGILAGADNSLKGIPSYWLNLEQNEPKVRDNLSMIKKLSSFWSGVYNHELHNSLSPVIGIPNSFQPRSNLKIISQNEYRYK